MALDYKALQAIDPELLPASETYCPECGQSLTPPVVADDRLSAHPWWWALTVVGISLVVASGLHAVHDAQLVIAENGSSVNQLLPSARARLEHDLLVGAVGLVLVLMAFGIGARQRLVRDHPDQTGLLGVLLEVWRSGETLVISLFGLITLVYSSLLVSELGVGQTLSLELIDRTLTRVVDVIVLIAELVAAGYPKL